MPLKKPFIPPLTSDASKSRFGEFKSTSNLGTLTSTLGNFILVALVLETTSTFGVLTFGPLKSTLTFCKFQFKSTSGFLRLISGIYTSGALIFPLNPLKNPFTSGPLRSMSASDAVMSNFGLCMSAFNKSILGPFISTSTIGGLISTLTFGRLKSKPARSGICTSGALIFPPIPLKKSLIPLCTSGEFKSISALVKSMSDFGA